MSSPSLRAGGAVGCCEEEEAIDVLAGCRKSMLLVGGGLLWKSDCCLDGFGSLTLGGLGGTPACSAVAGQSWSGCGGWRVPLATLRT